MCLYNIGLIEQITNSYSGKCESSVDTWFRSQRRLSLTFFFFANISLNTSRIYTLNINIHALMRRAPWSTMPCRRRGQLAGGEILAHIVASNLQQLLSAVCRAAVASSAAKIATYFLCFFLVVVDNLILHYLAITKTKRRKYFIINLKRQVERGRRQPMGGSHEQLGVAATDQQLWCWSCCFCLHAITLLLLYP